MVAATAAATAGCNLDCRMGRVKEGFRDPQIRRCTPELYITEPWKSRAIEINWRIRRKFVTNSNGVQLGGIVFDRIVSRQNAIAACRGLSSN